MEEQDPGCGKTKIQGECKELFLGVPFLEHKLLGEQLAAERPEPRAGAAAEDDGGDRCRGQAQGETPKEISRPML